MTSLHHLRLCLAFACLVVFASAHAQSVAEVRDELIQMRQLDQEGREEIAGLREEFGNDSEQLSRSWEKQNVIDRENMARLEEIIERFGWPTISTFGEDAANGAFLILQHADLATQQKYLPVFRDAVDEGEARASAYALLYDRVLMREGKKQLYGSQLTRDSETGGYYF